MRLLIAEDDSVSCRMLEAMLRDWNHEVVVTRDGQAAWQALQGDDAPRLAILDRMMPGLDGLQLCRRIRETPRLAGLYVMLLTVMGRKDDVLSGLDAGADDYLTKPFDRDELRARLNNGLRIVELQESLARRVRELEDAVAQVKQLQGLLPICSYCKKIRNDKNYWQQVEGYISDRSGARFSHSICPDCYQVIVQPQLDQLVKK